MLKRFLHDRRGGVAVMAALSIVPVIGLAGAAVDYNRASVGRETLQTLLDNAALAAVARESLLTRKTYAESFVEERKTQLPAGATLVDVTADNVVDPTTGAQRLRVTARARQATSFMGLVGVEEIEYEVVTEAVLSGRHTEVVMVVDVTGSMKGQKIRALREAAEDFVTTLLANDAARERIRVAIVPYSSAVNIGRDRMSFLDPDPESPFPSIADALSAADGHEAIVSNRYVFDESEVKKEHCKGTNTTWDDDLDLCYVGTLSEWTGDGECPGVARGDTCWVADAWAGCVMERYGTAYELTAHNPITASFRPYYWPSFKGPGGGNPDHNSYLPGPLDESATTNATGNNGRGPNLGCPKNEIISFSNDTAMLVDEIRGFEAWHRGGTMGHVGLLWGWRMLSPAWRGLWTDTIAPHDDANWPHDFERATTEKIVVFMTDGVNGFFSGMAPPDDSDFTAYGRLSDTEDFTSSNNRQLLDQRMQTVCEGLRADGVEIFTVGFQLNNDAAKKLLRDCAHTPLHDFTSDTKTLAAHFQAIASDIAERRIAITR